MALLEGHRAQFETLKCAFKNGDVALMECRRSHVMLALTDEEAAYLKFLMESNIKQRESAKPTADMTAQNIWNRLKAETSILSKLNQGKEKVAVICAVNRSGRGKKAQYDFAPFAAFFNDNPYELLEPPDPDKPEGFIEPEKTPPT